MFFMQLKMAQDWEWGTFHLWGLKPNVMPNNIIQLGTFSYHMVVTWLSHVVLIHSCELTFCACDFKSNASGSNSPKFIPACWVADTKPCSLETFNQNSTWVRAANSARLMTPVHVRWESGLGVAGIHPRGVHTVVPVFRNETLKWVIPPPPVNARLMERLMAVLLILVTSTEEICGSGMKYWNREF